MGIPNFPAKYKSRPLFTAAEKRSRSARAVRQAPIDVPERMIFCYQPSLLHWITKTHKVRAINGFLGECYLLKDTPKPVAVAGNFGIGSPVAVVLLEEYVASGMSVLVSLGLAGGLKDGLQAGDLVLCDRAIRDEGTSYHYLPPNKFANASPMVTSQLYQSMQDMHLPFLQGTSWTTDAPYRETCDEAVQFRRDGVLTVEMEASGLFAAGEALGTSVGAAFSIADSLESSSTGIRWRLNFDTKRSLFRLNELFSVAIAALSNL